ncbi:MAG: aquaporin [Gammaproteobacteria bacterium]|nr:aquaporin [Gammaproteobacteria bacterium]
MEKRSIFVAEAVGTYALVLAGTGAIIINDLYGGALGHLGIALVFGMVVMAMIYAVGEVSGAHFNPAVTLGFVAAKRMPLSEAPLFIIAQLTGAILASASLWALLPEHPTMGATLPSGSQGQSFGFEIILTAILMFVILCVSTGAKEKGISAGAAIGATVGLEALFAGPVTGASMNPARSIAPALFSGELNDLWIYIAAPIIGAMLAVMICRHVHDCDDGECCGPE